MPSKHEQHQAASETPCLPEVTPCEWKHLRESGLSLIELLVAMIVLLMVMSAAYGIWFGMQRTYTFTSDDLQAQEQARAAMGEMVESIRTARAPVDPPGGDDSLSPAIPKAEPESIYVWTDIDDDALHTLEFVHYFVDRTSTGDVYLYREQAAPGTADFSGSPTVLVTHDIVNDSSTPLFLYLDSADATMTPTAEDFDVTQVRSIVIDLRIKVSDPGPRANQLTSTVQPRNLRQ